MTEPYNHRFLFFLLTISAFGTLTILIFSARPPAPAYNVSWRKPLVGSMFVATCALGILATLSPKTCANSFNKPESTQENSQLMTRTGRTVLIKGHHRDCGRFANHVIQLRNITLCAACIGLALGSLAGLIISVPYFYFDISLLGTNFYLVILGQMFLILGFTQFKFNAYPRLLLNVLFVLGASITLVEFDGLIQNVFYEVYMISVMIVWILTRSAVSQWDHWKICRTCPYPCHV